MLPEDLLKDLLTQKELSNTDKMLICLAVEPVAPKQVKEIVALAKDNGLPAAKRWNVSALLQRSGGKAARTKDGWELTAAGVQYVSSLAGPLAGSPAPKAASSLRAYLSKITSPDIASFVQEAITCCETRQFRAAVVLSWVGAVAVLQEHVIQTPGLLAAFNADAVARFAGSRNPFVAAKKADELGRLQESDFLVVLEKISVLDKNTKQELERCLKLRNSCGHPNSYRLGEEKAAAHISDLILNVYSKFA